MPLATLFIVILNPLFAFPLVVGNFFKRRKTFTTALILSLIFGYIAYFSKSRYIGDLERYMRLLTVYGRLDFAECFDQFYTRLYAMDIIFWISSRLPNSRFFVSVVACICYFCVFWIVLDWAVMNKLDNRRIVRLITAVLCFLPFYTFLASSRSSIALSIGLTGLYRDYFRKKRDVLTIISYVVPVLIHQAGTVVLLIRLLLLFPDKTRRIVLIISGLLVVLMGLGIMNFAEYLLGTNISFISDALKKAVGYSGFGSEQYSAWATSVRNGIFPRVRKLLFLIPLVLLAVPSGTKMTSLIKKELFSVCQIISVLIISMMFFPTAIYMRFMTGFSAILVIGIMNRIGRRGLFWRMYFLLALLLQCYSLFEAVPYERFLGGVLLGILNLTAG